MGKYHNEALSLANMMGDCRPVPGPKDDVVIVPSHSPSIHSVEIFDTDHEAVQVVTREEAESAGFTLCVHCWEGVDPDTPKSLDDLGRAEETGDE